MFRYVRVGTARRLTNSALGVATLTVLRSGVLPQNARVETVTMRHRSETAVRPVKPQKGAADALGASPSDAKKRGGTVGRATRVRERDCPPPEVLKIIAVAKAGGDTSAQPRTRDYADAPLAGKKQWAAAVAAAERGERLDVNNHLHKFLALANLPSETATVNEIVDHLMASAQPGFDAAAKHEFALTETERMRYITADTSPGRQIPPPRCIATQANLIWKIFNDESRSRSKEKKVRIPVVYGPSGCGKTYCGIAVARVSNGVCARLVSEELCESFDDYIRTHAAATDDERRARRNNAAIHAVLSGLKQLIPVEYRRAPSRGEKPLIVLLDEFGEPACREFVRGICRTANTLRGKIQATFTGGCPVLIMLSGTGIEGTSNAAGSEPSTFYMVRAEPNMDLLFNDRKTYGPAFQALRRGHSRTSRLLRSLLANARAAAAFAQKYSEQTCTALVDTNPAFAVQLAATEAALEFKKLNGLEKYSAQEYLYVVLVALSLHASQSTVDTNMMDRLSCGLGIVVDRSERKAPRDAAPDDEVIDGGSVTGAAVKTRLFLNAKYHEVRYAAEPQQHAILQLCLGVGARHSSSEGFEQAAADFLLFAMLWARQLLWAGPRREARQHLPLPNLGLIERYQSKQGTRPPEGWHPPLSIVKTLRDACSGIPQRGIQIVDASTKIEHGCDDTALQQAQRHLRKGDLIVLNAAKASYADVIVLTDRALLLVQTKRWLKGTLTHRGVFAELWTMGHRDWRCALADAIATIQADPKRCEDFVTQRLERDSARRTAILIHLRAMVEQRTYKATFDYALSKADGGLLRPLADAHVAMSGANDATTRLGGGARRLLYVVMAYGTPPEAVPRGVPSDVVLLFARSHGGEKSAAIPEFLLDRYFPIAVDEPDDAAPPRQIFQCDVK